MNKFALAAALLASTVFVSPASASVLIEGNGKFDATVPVTAHSKPKASVLFSFSVPDVLESYTANSASTVNISNFFFSLGGVPVAGAPSSVIFYTVGFQGMFDLVFGSDVFSVYGVDIGSDGTVGPDGNYQPVQFASNQGAAAGVGNVTVTVLPAVPEPATWGLMLAGFAAVGMSMRRRQNTRVSFA